MKNPGYHFPFIAFVAGFSVVPDDLVHGGFDFGPVGRAERVDGVAQPVVVDGENLVGGQHKVSVSGNFYQRCQHFHRRGARSQGDDHRRSSAAGDVVVLDGHQKGDFGFPAAGVGIDVVLSQKLYPVKLFTCQPRFGDGFAVFDQGIGITLNPVAVFKAH